MKEVAPTCPDSRRSNGQDNADLRDPNVAGVLREYCDEGPGRTTNPGLGTQYDVLWGWYAHSSSDGGATQPGYAEALGANAVWPKAHRR